MTLLDNKDSATSGVSRLVSRKATKPARRWLRRIIAWALPGSAITTGLLILVLLIIVAGTDQIDNSTNNAKPTAPADVPAAVDSSKFDPGNIISDAVFFNTKTMTPQQIQSFLDSQAPTCTAATCLRNMHVNSASQPATELCGAYQGGTDELFSLALYNMSQACGINPQVLLATIEKESAGLTRTNPAPGWDAALLGFACPDTGPGGSANCAAGKAGAVAQTWGLAQVFQKYTKHPGDYNYKIGENHILYNVVEQCQQTKTVNIVNQATADLYIYTPYTPSDASLAAGSGAVGGPDAACASYGNRNFWNLFRKYFGATGGGASTGGAGGPAGAAVTASGPSIRLPAAAGITGTITAPNNTTAKAIAAGLSELGIPYSWGGGGINGPTTGTLDGCSQRCFENHPLSTVGFDCAGLMLYSWAQAGVSAPRNSQTQASSGQQIPYAQHVAGDMIGYPGHVAMYLGTFNGADYMLEAPYSGSHVRVAAVRDGHYPNVARIWQGLS